MGFLFQCTCFGFKIVAFGSGWGKKIGWLIGKMGEEGLPIRKKEKIGQGNIAHINALSP